MSWWRRARSIASATRSETSSSSSASSSVKRAGASEPTWSTPIACVSDDERHAEQGLHAALAQDRVEDVRPLDVVEDDPPAIGRDPARKAASERDAHAALDLLLEPEGRPGHQLVRVLIDQQHHAGVDVENRPDPRQHHPSSSSRPRWVSATSVTAWMCSSRVAGRALRLVQACVVDRDRGPVGHHLQQLDVIRVERAGNERADVEDAYDPRLDEERHAEQRPDPFLSQQRVQYVRVLDVVEDDGLAVGGDTTRETAAERDAHAALDLLLDPDRRPGDELQPVVVEEEHGACVDLEQLPRPFQQRGE